MGSEKGGSGSDNPSVGAFSPPLRLTGHLFELWASRATWAEDELLGTGRSADVIPLRTGQTAEPVETTESDVETTSLRRTAAHRDSR
jgi:hypothetical protein